jgi:hypothetical protein
MKKTLPELIINSLSISIITILILFFISFSFTSCSSCSSEPPTLCDCLTTKGDLPSGCDKVLKDRYRTSDPSLDQMRTDYKNCKK